MNLTIITIEIGTKFQLRNKSHSYTNGCCSHSICFSGRKENQRFITANNKKAEAGEEEDGKREENRLHKGRVELRVNCSRV